jgi:hypothetical protein
MTRVQAANAAWMTRPLRLPALLLRWLMMACPPPPAAAGEGEGEGEGDAWSVHRHAGNGGSMSWLRFLMALAVASMGSCTDAGQTRFLLFTSEGVLACESQAACERQARDGYSIVSRAVPRPGPAIIGGVLQEDQAPRQCWKLIIVGHGHEDDGSRTYEVSSATRVQP